MTDLLKVLPLAVVMVAGPQMITAIMLVTSTRHGSSSVTADWVIVAVLLLAAAWAFRNRHTSQPPRWMSTL